MITTLTPRYADAVDLAELKLEIKQDDITDDDTILRTKITTAQSLVELGTGANGCRNRVLLATTFLLTLDHFPRADENPFPRNTYIEIPRVPLLSVASIKYVDQGGVTQTMDPATYVVDLVNARIILAYNIFWPVPRFQLDAVTVMFTSGQAANLTASGAVITVKGRTLTTGAVVRLANSGGALPAGLLANTDYYVLTSGTGLSLSSGGSAIVTTDAGTGTHYITDQSFEHFENCRGAMKALVAYWNNNREGIVAGTRAAAIELPLFIRQMIDLAHA